MAELLSWKMVVGSCWFYDKSFNILLIQTTWHATPVAMTYYASAEDCFFESHDKTPVPKWNVYPNVFFLSFVLPPLSLSVYPMSLKFSEVEYIMPRSSTPLTYLKNSSTFLPMWVFWWLHESWDQNYSIHDVWSCRC